MHRQPCDTLIRAGILITQNDGRDIIYDAAVAVTAGRIESVGTWATLADGYAPAEILDLSDRIVLPGLINTHTHAAMTLFRGLADDLLLMEWLELWIWPREARLTRADVRTGVLLACAEMIRGGTTTFLDMYHMIGESAVAADVCGLRAVLSQGIIGLPGFESSPPGVWEIIEREMTAWAGHPRITWAIGPHATYTTSPEVLRHSFALAERHDLLWTIHAAETRSEDVRCLEMFGLRPVPYLQSLGLLTPRTLISHGVWLGPEDIRMLAESGTMIANTPRSEMKLASGMAPLSEMRAVGVPVGLGTDGAASNNSLSMFAEMAAAALLSKARLGDPTALPAQAVLDMATREGARALRLPDLGRIVPGCRADIIALDAQAPHLRPLYNPVSQVVYAATGGDVCMTMVDGRILYRDGRYLTLDVGELRQILGDLAI